MEPRVRPSEIVIRPLEPADDPAMHAIKIAEGNFPTTGIAPSTSLASFKERMAKLAVDDGRHSFAALVGDRLVGVAGLIVAPRPRMRHVASLWLEVHEDFHGQGVGTALMTKLLDLADR